VKIFDDANRPVKKEERYLNCQSAEKTYAFEQFFGFDGVKRIGIGIPFSGPESEVLEETRSFIVRLDEDGWVRKYKKGSDVAIEETSTGTSMEYWEALKRRTKREMDKYQTDENIRKIYGRFRDGHERGDYSIRFSMAGFFWIPRGLYGIEGHFYAFYDYPEIMHDINEFILKAYMDKLGKIFDILPPEVVYISEDLSGKNGPMLSPAMFDEFVGAYYKRLVPFMKSKGAKNVLVDTDGDFSKLIPNFTESGIDGFLPVDVNAGVDIVEVRRKFPELKFIGGFNKLMIAEGQDAIDREFERLLPVIRQGGFIPGCDHQVAPSTSFENYKYYISRLKEVMLEACKG
jgi:hypothetical protein